MIKVTEKGILVKLRVIPNSSKNCIIYESTAVKVKVMAPPVDNKANQALVVFLSKISGVAKSNIEITKGATSKEKTILIKVTEEKLQKRVIEKLKSNG